VASRVTLMGTESAREILGSVLRELDRRAKLYIAFLAGKVWSKARAIRQERCWLLGGMSGKAYADNSAALHRYLIRERPDIHAYWVIDRDSPDVDRARQAGPVLFRDDLRTYVYGLLAQVQVISHGLADVPTFGSSLSNRAVKVRLGHGLTALKRTGGSRLRSVAAKSRFFDLVPVSSEFEKEHKASWGIARERIVVTGLPRFDELLRKDSLFRSQADAAGARILYMPTWRDWLPADAAHLRATDFYRQVMALVLHPDLNRCLADHNVVLDLHLHILARHHQQAIGQELAGLSQVRLLPAGEDLQEAIVRSGLLITDYSSVAWDFLYLDRPVLFYQFDAEMFKRHRGAHIELHDLFGPITADPDTAVALTCHFVETGFDCHDYRQQMERWQGTAFPYRDDRNCERVVSAILARLQG
jgi:CDP-glycerol glycerophosphotransferase (TagB/SpsB family)